MTRRPLELPAVPTTPKNGHAAPPPAGYPEKDTLVRRLALAKLRELRQAGLSYREIGRRFGASQGGAQTGATRFAVRLSPERLLTGERTAPEAVRNRDAATFLRALDALEPGLAFFDCNGTLVHMNRPLRQVLEVGREAGHLRKEVQHFATSLCGIVRIRSLMNEHHVEELAMRDVPAGEEHFRLKGSYVGLDLFGAGGSVLVSLERIIPNALSDDTLRARFGLTRGEGRVLRLLVEGKSNADIAKALFISPHTARTHVKTILSKLNVRSRAAATARVLRGTSHEGYAI
jgi:DNA-binding CsgD family transcriptional regulator